jgi:chemotaxis protein histidine kinase CheA
MHELTRDLLIDSQDMDRMECCFTDLGAHPTDSALLTEIFRALHTIKGTTGLLVFKRLEKLAQARREPAQYAARREPLRVADLCISRLSFDECLEVDP